MEAHQRLSNHCKLSKTEFPRYLMHVMVSRQEVNVANKNVPIELWHIRTRDLGTWINKTLGSSKEESFAWDNMYAFGNLCDCLASKQHKVAFPHLTPKGNLIHWNWCLHICVIWKIKLLVVHYTSLHSLMIFKSFHASVGREIRRKLKCIYVIKVEYVGKHVPPDGRCREPARHRTGPDRF